MKISKPVAKGLAVAGIVGLTGVAGGITYDMIRQRDIQNSPEYRWLEDITEQQAQRAQDYIMCTMDPAADCRSVREDYLTLHAEAEQITNSPAYMLSYTALVAESEAIHSRYPFWVAGFAAASALGIVGAFAYQRRKDEEDLVRFTDLMGQVVDRCKSINQAMDATIKKLQVYNKELSEDPLSEQPEPDDAEKNQKKYLR
ncbi:MAG: hypothetical protein Q8R53_06225 [Nanoarchaeota archaeon]|nr:hypothetical protein [Nanoarchaeota archaeon]